MGIDLGAWAVKVAVLEGSFGRYALKEVHARRVHTEGGVLPGLAERLEALGSLLEEEELQDVHLCAVGWPADRASLRSVELPFDDRNKITRIIPFEVENYVPFDMEDMVLEHRVLAAGDGRSRVLACLVRSEELGQQLEGLRQLGLEPRYMALDADVHSAWTGQGVQAVIDIGHARTLVSLVADGQVQGVRSILFGGHTLSWRLQHLYELDPLTAERAVHGADLGLRGHASGPAPVEVDWEDDEKTVPSAPPPGQDSPLIRKGTPPNPAVLSRVLRESVLELVGELRTTLIAFEDQHGLSIDSVLLTGGGSSHSGLASLLGRELGVPVRRVPAPDAPGSAVMEGQQGYALCDALGQRAAGSLRGSPLELRQGEFAHHGSLEILRSLASYGAAAAIFFVIAGAVVFFMNHRQLSAEIEEMEDSIAAVVGATFPETPASQLESATDAVMAMQIGTLSTTQKVEALRAAIRGEPPTLTLLREFSEAMPPPEEAKIDVKEMTLSETAISVKASTDGYEQAAKIEASLQNAARFKGAAKGDEKKKGDKVEFNLTIPLETGEEEQAEG